jgi:Zn-dependent protease with chaperone function
MDFFGHQDAARRSSRRLVILFALAVTATIGAVYLVIAAFARANEVEMGGPFGIWNAALFAAVAAGTGVVIGGGSLYKTVALSRGGGEGVATLLGGRPLDPNTTDPAEQRLLNVVEEMAIASGTAVPSVFVLPEEGNINAFAAGHSRDAAVIGVTRGGVERLSRDELQGVVAHEFSHILNGDMRLNLRLMGLVHGILVISLIGYWILRTAGSGGSGKKKEGGGIALLGLGLYVIGWVGVFFGDLIKSAISRQREYLADAAAVQFTRNPAGIAGALKKIAGSTTGARIGSRNAAQASHLFFGNGLGEKFFAWRATHPPLTERIRRLDPTWGRSLDAGEAAPAGAEQGAKGAREAWHGSEAANAARPPGASAAASLASAAAPAPAATVAAGLAPAQLAAAAGQPRPVHLAAAANFLQALPPALRERAHEPMAARAVALALLCDSDAAVRELQLASVSAAGDGPLAAELTVVLPAVDRLPGAARLPLLDLCLPALRRLSAPQYQAFRACVDELVRADARLSVFEYTLHRVLLRHLDPMFSRRPPVRVKHGSVVALGEACSILLSTLAWVGGGDEVAAGAFAAGAAALGRQTPRGLSLRPRAECTFRRLDDALAELETVAPPRLRELLVACAATVAHDGEVSGAEGELLRAVADALGCPVPPLVAAA